MTRHLIFDTETTDLFSNTIKTLDKQPEIFEFYGLVLDMDTFEIVEDLHLFSKPVGKIAKGAAKATGKADADFVDYPPFADNAERIKTFIESCDAVVAHNLNYDVTVTNFEFKRLDSNINWPELICTVEKTEWIEGFRLSLTALHTLLFEEDFGNKHEAKADVQALARCYIELKKRNWI